MDNRELVRSFETLAANPAAKTVTARLKQMVNTEVEKMANATDQASMFKAQGRYQALLEISRWFDLEYLADLKTFTQER